MWDWKKNQLSIMNIMSETTCSSFYVPTKNLLSIDPTQKIVKRENQIYTL